MSQQRRTKGNTRPTIGAALLGLLLGVGLGLLAGWVLWPAQYDSVTPELLAADHQSDYAKMVAAAYERAGRDDALPPAVPDRPGRALPAAAGAVAVGPPPRALALVPLPISRYPFSLRRCPVCYNGLMHRMDGL